MTRCTKTIFSRTILCAGTMTDYIMIKSRVQQGSGVDETDISHTFTNIANYMGYLEDRNPVQRFDGIVIGDNVTHIIYIPYEQEVYELDKNTIFIEVESTRNKYYKPLSMIEYNEQYLAFYCMETGFTDLVAAEG